MKKYYYLYALVVVAVITILSWVAARIGARADRSEPASQSRAVRAVERGQL